MSVQSKRQAVHRRTKPPAESLRSEPVVLSFIAMRNHAKRDAKYRQKYAVGMEKSRLSTRSNIPP